MKTTEKNAGKRRVAKSAAWWAKKLRKEYNRQLTKEERILLFLQAIKQR